MSIIDPSDDPTTLAAAVEANAWAAATAWGRALGATFTETPDLLAFASGLPLQLGNMIIRARLPADNTDAAIDAVLARFAAPHLPHCWLVGPATQPGDLGRRLAARGMFPDKAPGMAVALGTLPAAAPTPPGLTVDQVAGSAALRAWIDTLVGANPLPADVARVLHGLHTQHGYRPHPAVHYFLGRLDGAPVATSLLFYSAGVAGLYCVATVPAARRQGIGAAVTLAPLLAARAAGYRRGVLQSSGMGLGVYRALGFREAGRFSLYYSPS